jgi:hypothetical protein
MVVEFPISREASQVSFPHGWSIKMPSAKVRIGEAGIMTVMIPTTAILATDFWIV